MGNEINCLCFRKQTDENKKECIIANLDGLNENANDNKNDADLEKKNTNLNTNSIIIIQNNYQGSNTDNNDNNNLIDIVKNNQGMLKTLVKINSPDPYKNKNNNNPSIIISEPESIIDPFKNNYYDVILKDNSKNVEKKLTKESDLKSNKSKKSNRSTQFKKDLNVLDNDDNYIQINKGKKSKFYTQSIKNVSESFSKKFDRFKEEPYEVVVTFFGKSNTGKTSIISRICKNSFEYYHIPTIKVESFCLNTRFNQKLFKINFIDTCGLDEYMSDTMELLKYTDYVCYIADLTDSNSFSYIESLYSDHKKSNKNNTLKYFIVANKSDLAKSYSKKSYIEFAESINIQLIEVSALNSINISKITRSILENVIEYIK